jgi:hypothetical protein
VQPSSLVFLVIIGVWAAYFIQHWVRRREHLATVRAVDQFSESMRILDREAKQDAAPRDARPHLLKRQAGVATATTAVELVGDAEVRSGRPRSGEYAAPRQPRRSASRLRGLAVVTAFLGLLVVAALAALGMVPVVAGAAPALLLVTGMVWLRRGVARNRAARRAGGVPSPATSARVSSPAPQVRGQGREVARRQVERHAPEVEGAEAGAHAAAATGHAAEVRQESAIEPAAPARVRGELFDVQAFDPAPAAPAAPHRARGQEPVAVEAEVPEAPLVDDDDIPLTWDPRPVPRPTYTMKSRVTRPAPTAADLVGDADTEYAAYEETDQARRVAGA